MKRLIIALAALAGLFIVVPTASASGDCTQAYVIMYDGANRTGTARQMCWGFSDFNIQSEPGTVIGPLAAGNFGDDFDGISDQSGIGSIYFSDPSGGVDAGVCFYDDTSLNGSLLAFRFSSGLMQATQLYRAGSFKFITGSSC